MISPPLSASQIPPSVCDGFSESAWDTSATRCIAGIREIVDRYDLFLVDQWGVLHDGQTVYPGAVACLEELKRLDKRVVVLSNSGKPISPNVRRLQSMGIDPSYYTSLISSGAVVGDLLKKRAAPFDQLLGTRCLLLTSDGQTILLNDTEFSTAPTVEQADLILLAGVNDESPWAYYQDLLERALRRGIPLVCANPDQIRFSDAGLTFSAGAVAKRYAEMGGRTYFIGKPYPAIYAYCRDTIENFDPRRTVAIGDSLEHDVRGGSGAGLATVFVMDGIHHRSFADAATQSEQVKRLESLIEDNSERPDWIVKQFAW